MHPRLVFDVDGGMGVAWFTLWASWCCNLHPAGFDLVLPVLVPGMGGALFPLWTLCGVVFFLADGGGVCLLPLLVLHTEGPLLCFLALLILFLFLLGFVLPGCGVVCLVREAAAC